MQKMNISHKELLDMESEPQRKPEEGTAGKKKKELTRAEEIEKSIRKKFHKPVFPVERILC